MAESGLYGMTSAWLAEARLEPPAPVPMDRAPPPPWPDFCPAQPLRSRRELVARTVTADVLPRLTLARRGTPGRAGPDGVAPAAAVAELADIAIAKGAASALAFAQRAQARGMSLEALYLDLLAPAARHLGVLWTDDVVDFTQVTIGLGRLQQVLRQLSPAFQSGVVPHGTGRHALLVPAPGEHHTFGLSMVTEFFRRAAWSVWSGVPATPAELGSIVRDNWFAIIGFSLGAEVRLDGLRAGIRRVRQVSQNRGVGIMVGGPLFIEHPELVAQVGADATAADGRQAVSQAQTLLTLLPGCV